MRGRYGERISIYSEDLSVPTLANEFRFCTSHFYNQCKNNLFHSFSQGTSGFCVHMHPFGRFYAKIDTSRTIAFFQQLWRTFLVSNCVFFSIRALSSIKKIIRKKTQLLTRKVLHSCPRCF